MVYFEFPRRRGQEAFPREPGSPADGPELQRVQGTARAYDPSHNLLSIVQKKGRGSKGCWRRREGRRPAFTEMLIVVGMADISLSF